ncbi:general transcription factor II-I repeat domain-containing protein 2B-like [Schistocerca gregaria]|uniref:general transcription factor II-I repeat domain-containing protein 2B-like n=1 Tax=Schistocerca gregaria TaxID=7010 RepID=UPI00211F0CF4|nr:general transcription factor II-I repeat domain-containing protein 2B-like [Schistocerca gregaria]
MLCVHFPSIALVVSETNLEQERLKEHFDWFVMVLQSLEGIFHCRFEDLNRLECDVNLFVTPFAVNIENVPYEIQLELIDFQCNCMLKEKFRPAETLESYKYFPRGWFPLLFKIAARVYCFLEQHTCAKVFSP